VHVGCGGPPRDRKGGFWGEVRGGAGTYGLAAKAFPGVLCTPEGPDTGASGGGAGVFLGRGSEGVTHSSPPWRAMSWARRLPRAGPATPSGSCSFEAIYDRFELKRVAKEDLF
jgi:hypothetical protein